ncbi:MAG: NAD(P)H-hydrate dehydratase [Cyclobacteriaceae bacterium]|nr:NAD(P)H-hydrate dehydratase [Cyclobacteriaceae bacterium]
MKVLSAKQIKELDAYTITHEPIASIDLMERACKAFSSWFTERFDPTVLVGIICGTGNNGGDGLGIARLLSALDYSVRIWIIKGGTAESDDFKINLSRLKVDVTVIEESVSDGMFSSCAVLIDAVFGTGLSRPVEGLYARVIETMNQIKAIRIAVDIPSGLSADSTSVGTIVHADYTVSFQVPKLAFLFAENYAYVGEWFIVDIGLSKSQLKEIETNQFLLTRKSINNLIKPVKRFDHKGKRGHGLLIAGSKGKMGAAVLASRSALRTGMGLLTTHVPGCGYSILQTAVPEAMVDLDKSDSCFTTFPDISTYDAIGIGPGLGRETESAEALQQLLNAVTAPLVMDADALNIMGEHRELLSRLPSGTIVTPHPKEFERMAGTSSNDFERLTMQVEFSKRYNVIVVLKGAFTSITSPDGKVYFNQTGNPAMATAGSGDVLTGVLTALLALGYSPLEAAQVGVWLHGLAGDVACRKTGRTIIASDIIEAIPQAFEKIC